MEKKTLYLIALNLLLGFYSLSGVFSKLAAEHPFMSAGFVVFYGLTLFILFAYALGWQQVLKRLPLTIAFSNKAITVVWGIVWGAVLFHDSITVGKVIGAVIIIVGIVLLASADDDARVSKGVADD